MRNLIGHVFDSKQFMWHKELRILSSEVSMTPQILRQLWADSMDLGFAMRSHKTGQVAYFTLHQQEASPEGETLKWIFKPSEKSVERQPGLKGVFVHVYNT